MSSRRRDAVTGGPGEEREVDLRELDASSAQRVAGWFAGDDEGRRRFGAFFGDHPRWWELVERDPHRHGFVASVVGEEVGFVDLEQIGERVNVAIYVRSERRGGGLGVALLTAAVVEASRLAGATELVAEIESDNPASRRCCERRGFTESGVNAHGETIFVLDLARAR